jgi:hypothetical protein
MFHLSLDCDTREKMKDISWRTLGVPSNESPDALADTLRRLHHRDRRDYRFLLGFMISPSDLRCSLRWPSRSSSAKRFSLALEP